MELPAEYIMCAMVGKILLVRTFLLCASQDSSSIMRFSNSISLISVLCTRVLAAPKAAVQARDLNSFVTSEKAIALQGALNNIGPNGSMVAGAGAGFVVASLSKANPNCKFGVLNIWR